MSKFTRRQAKYVKKPYRVRNWAEYEAGLRNRCSLTVWLGLDPGTVEIAGWNASSRGPKKRGRKKTYSNLAIETSKRIGMVFHLHLRQTEGFLTSLFELLKLNLDVPDHTTLSRRSKTLGKVPHGHQKNDRPIHLIIDSSGFNVHVGQLRKPPKNRDYRKLHLGIDEKTGEVVACDLTSKRATDESRVPSLLAQIDRPISSLRADSAYDSQTVYHAAENHGEDRTPRVLIPPKKNAKLHPSSKDLKERNRNIRSRQRIGKRSWHTQSGYSARAKVETTMSRFKMLIGPALHSRNLANQRVEARNRVPNSQQDD
jgi:hypothetical protein